MDTVAEAIANGKTHLEVTCATCRCLFHIPWGLLRGVTDSDRIDEIASRLIHKKCGSRPDPASVRTHGHSDVKYPGFSR